METAGRRGRTARPSGPRSGRLDRCERLSLPWEPHLLCWESFFSRKEPDMPANSSPTRKLFLLLGSVALLAASFALATPRTASALPSQSCFCSYYTNGVQTGEWDVY